MTAFSTYLNHPEPKIRRLKLNKLDRFYNSVRDRTDKAMLTLDIDADLRSVFNWNVKQLFVVVQAEYTSTSNVRNQMVLWDRIITRRKDARLKLKNERSEYFLSDQHDELRDAEVRLTLLWDIMPLTGRLFMHELNGTTFQMPTVYISSKTK